MDDNTRDQIAKAMLARELELDDTISTLIEAGVELPEPIGAGYFEFVLDLYGIPKDTGSPSGTYEEPGAYCRDWTSDVLLAFTHRDIDSDRVITILKDPEAYFASLPEPEEPEESAKRVAARKAITPAMREAIQTALIYAVRARFALVEIENTFDENIEFDLEWLEALIDNADSWQAVVTRINTATDEQVDQWLLDQLFF